MAVFGAWRFSVPCKQILCDLFSFSFLNSVSPLLLRPLVRPSATFSPRSKTNPSNTPKTHFLNKSVTYFLSCRVKSNCEQTKSGFCSVLSWNIVKHIENGLVSCVFYLFYTHLKWKWPFTLLRPSTSLGHIFGPNGGCNRGFVLYMIHAFHISSKSQVEEILQK